MREDFQFKPGQANHFAIQVRLPGTRVNDQRAKAEELNIFLLLRGRVRHG
jgi:hypothetical protein